MSKYSVGGRVFSSKGEIHEAVSKIKSKYERLENVMGDDFDFILGLARFHGDYGKKFPKGINQIKLDHGDPAHSHAYAIGNECFWGRASEQEEWVDFSCRKAINDIPVPKRIDGEWLVLSK
ncbi:DUF3223 domain-containing protein [Lujinxingia sediminis]|uniref:DUF3223 domain-containing protein n=1 Tax=Lujinxingia sediminis TaxID=2480984 RepID=A0ABY0CTS6_9DELT|nr:DUF3223 domain-containing protein [Lujinxingia sediminis]RVU44715.1 DUF3223 domain-containing protein [Lujinxingia sediminis]